MRKYVMIAKLAMFAYVKYDFMTKKVRNLDMLRNFEHVMKLDETCKSLIVINQYLTKKESVN